MVLGLILFSAGSVAAEDRPDFTGIWGVVPGSGPFGPPWEGAEFLKPEAQKKVEEHRDLVEPTGDTPGGWCLGTGMPGSMLGSGGYPMEIIQRPEQITVIYEAHTELRRIYLDGPNANVPEGDLFPTRNGYSTGHWEGDTLVVETTHLKEQVDQSAAHSADAHIVERYHLESGEDGQRILVAEMTMTDPAFYTQPVTATKAWAEKENGRMLFYECNEPAWEDHLEELKAQAAEETQAAKND